MAAASAAIADFSRYSKPPPLGGGVFTIGIRYIVSHILFLSLLGEENFKKFKEFKERQFQGPVESFVFDLESAAKLIVAKKVS